MSRGSRVFLGGVLLLMGVSFAWVGTTGLVTPVGCWLFAAICVLGSVACTDGPARLVAGRILGAVIFAFCAAYLVNQVLHPVIPSLREYRRSQPNLPNALLAMLFFGIPALVYAVRGRRR